MTESSPSPTRRPDQRLEGRVALIAGASRGLGAAVAERFAAEGAHVVLAARTVGGLEEVDDRIRKNGGSATLVPLDLANAGQIDALGASLFERFHRLDVLVANAAMLGDLGPLAYSNPARWQKVIDLNLTGPYRLIRSMDPLLRLSPAGRAIFVTDAVGQTPTAYWGAYAVSKAGLEMLAGLYAAETVKTTIRVNTIDPGPLATTLRSGAFPGEPRDRQPNPATATDAFVRLAEATCTDHGTLVRARLAQPDRSALPEDAAAPGSTEAQAPGAENDKTERTG